MAKKDKVAKALVALKNALGEVGIDHYLLKLMDIEDADKLKALFDEESHPVRPPNGFGDRPLAFWCSIDGVMVQWPNKQVATNKGEDPLKRRRDKARADRVRREADRLARNARSTHLALHGVDP